MDNRRLILLLVFSFSLIMLWDAWQKQSLPKPVAATTAAASSAAVPAGVVPTPTLPAAGASAVPGAVPATMAAVAPGATSAKIKTDLYVVDISSRGGDITRLELVRHPDTEDKTKHFVLFDNGGKHVYLAQSGVIGEGLPNHKTEWKLPAGDHVLKEGEKQLEIKLEAAAANGGKAGQDLRLSSRKLSDRCPPRRRDSGRSRLLSDYTRWEAGRATGQFDDDGGYDFYRAGDLYRRGEVSESRVRGYSQGQGQVCAEGR